MFLILGHDECPYCDKAKALLDKRGLSYAGVNLKQVYQDWRQAFTDLQPCIKGQRSVPLIFYNKQATPPETLSIEGLKGWEFIGGYNDLEKYLFVKMGYELDDDY